MCNLSAWERQDDQNLQNSHIAESCRGHAWSLHADACPGCFHIIHKHDGKGRNVGRSQERRNPRLDGESLSQSQWRRMDLIDVSSWN